MADPTSGNKVSAFVETGIGGAAPLPQVVDGYNNHYATFPEVVVPVPAADSPVPPGRSCRLSKRWIILLVLAVILVVVGAVVGGVVGSRAHDSMSGGEAGSPQGASSTQTGSPGPSSTSTSTGAAASTATASPLAIAAAVDLPNGHPGIKVFYQTSNSADVKYRVYVYGEQYGAEYTIDLSLAPQPNMPMSLTSRSDSDGNTLLNLFYIYKTGTKTDIAMSEIMCNEGAANCAETSSSLVTANASNKVHPQSKIGAVWLGGMFTVRVYYQSVDGLISELNGDGAGSSGWSEGVAGGTAVNGTSIAVTFAPGPIINVFYATSGGGQPTVAVYNRGWESPVVVDTKLLQGWEETAVLAACYEPVPDTYRFYYVVPGTGQMIEYTHAGADSSWSRFGSSSIWLKVDSSMAAIGWNDQVRLLYSSKGNLQESVLGNGTWAATHQVGS